MVSLICCQICLWWRWVERTFNYCWWCQSGAIGICTASPSWPDRSLFCWAIRKFGKRVALCYFCSWMRTIFAQKAAPMTPKTAQLSTKRYNFQPFFMYFGVCAISWRLSTCLPMGTRGSTFTLRWRTRQIPLLFNWANSLRRLQIFGQAILLSGERRKNEIVTFIISADFFLIKHFFWRTGGKKMSYIFAKPLKTSGLLKLHTSDFFVWTLVLVYFEQ